MKKGDLVELLKRFYNEVLAKKPSFEKMREEAKAMGIKLRPVVGNLFDFALQKNDKLVEIVWTIGKLDEFLNNLRSVQKKDVDQFLELFNDLYMEKMIEELYLEIDKDFGLELEIYKRIPLKKSLN